MRVRRVVAVTAMLASLTSVPSAGAQPVAAQVVEPAAPALSGTFGLNGGGGGCPESTEVDVDLVPGGTWELSSAGWISTTTIGLETAAQPPSRPYVPFDEGECAVELVPTPGGYWMFTSAGRVIVAGAAVSHGDLSASTLNDPIVAAAPTPSGEGYYMLGADGGVFSFGDARFYGSVQGIVDETIGRGALAADHLNAPIVTLATTSAGYWLIAADGAVFPFGDAPYHGSLQDVLNTGNQLAGIERNWTLQPPVNEGVSLAKDALVSPIVDVVPSGAGAGYMMLASDGGIFNFGQTQFHGSAAGTDGFTAVASDVTPSQDGYVILMKRDNGYGTLLRTFGSLVERATAVNETAPAAAEGSVPHEVFANAAERRQLLISELTTKLNSGEYGLGSDGVLRGPAGFEIDISSCPNNWSNTTGITAAEIRIGLTTPLSGSLAFYSDFGAGWASYLNWVNENDPITVDGSPRSIQLLAKDDAFVATRTVTAVSELISLENIFSITTLGTSNTLSVYDTINESCIPHPFVISGHAAWGDPVHHPWTTGLLLSYSTEAALWGTWIQENLAAQLPVTVAGLVMDNDFGHAYESHFKEWADANPDVVKEFISIRHNPAAPMVTEQMGIIKDAKPNIFIAMTAGNPCTLAMTTAGELGLTDELDAAFVSSVCTNVEDYLAPAGDNADGWWSINNGGKQLDDPKYAQDPYVAWLNDTFEADGSLDSVLFGTGHLYGYAYVEALRIAAALPGGLTRANFILAIRSLELNHPLLVDGVPFSMNGNDDAYLIEGAEFRQFDAGAQVWKQVGEVVDLNGQTPNCNWSDVDGRCR